ncbi:MAG: hypothetical protein HC896_18435 [Bacteroidales bacterium]|nr:hypothetical protein [Bacteroidales bacterium]
MDKNACKGTAKTKKVEIINTAITAINSHIVLPMVKECAKYSPDLFILYMGNNEFIGPFGPGTYAENKIKRRDLIKVNVWMSKFRLYQLITNIAKPNAKDAQWEGLAVYTQHKMHISDRRVGHTYEMFQKT